MSTKKILIAVGILFIVAIMYWWLLPDNNWNGLKVITGQKDSVQLPDGSMAYLNGPSQIGCPKKFEEKMRKVKMEGEVYFEIVNDGKSFLIQTEKGGVETRSAKCIINTKGKKNITVHCLADSVRMIARGKKEILEIDLGENEMSSFTKGDGVIEKFPIDSTTLNKIKISSTNLLTQTGGQ